MSMLTAFGLAVEIGDWAGSPATASDPILKFVSCADLSNGEGTGMRKLRGKMHRRMLVNGYCARPFESCTFFVTGFRLSQA